MISCLGLALKKKKKSTPAKSKQIKVGRREFGKRRNRNNTESMVVEAERSEAIVRVWLHLCMFLMAYLKKKRKN